MAVIKGQKSFQTKMCQGLMKDHIYASCFVRFQLWSFLAHICWKMGNYDLPLKELILYYDIFSFVFVCVFVCLRSLRLATWLGVKATIIWGGQSWLYKGLTTSSYHFLSCLCSFRRRILSWHRLVFSLIKYILVCIFFFSQAVSSIHKISLSKFPSMSTL